MKKRKKNKKRKTPKTFRRSSLVLVVVLVCAFYLAWSRVVKGGEPVGLLEVELYDLSPSTGVVNVALFNSKEDYNVDEKPFRRAFQVAASDIRKGLARVRFEGLPFGTYAVVAFHDRNKNGQLDRSYFGIPTEDFGFSNNVRGFLSRPSFSRASFEVARPYQFKRIRIR